MRMNENESANIVRSAHGHRLSHARWDARGPQCAQLLTWKLYIVAQLQVILDVYKSKCNFRFRVEGYMLDLRVMRYVVHVMR